jgi:hypothetical protein
MSQEESFARICERVCAEQGWELLPTGVRVPLEAGRMQVVDFHVFESGERERVRLSTRIGPLSNVDEPRLEAALRVNAILDHGALAIMDDFVVMIDTLALEDTGADELEATIRFLGATADQAEERLFGTDEN